MTTAGRAKRLKAFAASAVGVALLGLGFGVTEASAHFGSHTGLFWLCNSGANCTFSGLATAPSNSMKTSRAIGLTANIAYDAKYVAGIHTEPTDAACENSSSTFAGGAAILADSTGSWSGVALTTPAVTGQYTKCVVGSSPFAIWSNFTPITFI